MSKTTKARRTLAFFAILAFPFASGALIALVAHVLWGNWSIMAILTVSGFVAVVVGLVSTFMTRHER